MEAVNSDADFPNSDAAPDCFGQQRRGFRLELSADDESVERVTSPGGNTLDHPSLDELPHLLKPVQSPRE
jgi:hypothetical protein